MGAMSQFREGQKVFWRERRGTDRSKLSETTYSGIRVALGDGRLVLITKLSHGLRVLLVNDDVDVFDETKTVNVAVPNYLVKAAQIAYQADLQFQMDGAGYDRLMES